MERTYTVIVRFTVTEDTEHLQTERAIRDEFTSWLEDLDAEVDSVTVHREEQL